MELNLVTKQLTGFPDCEADGHADFAFSRRYTGTRTEYKAVIGTLVVLGYRRKIELSVVGDENVRL